MIDRVDIQKRFELIMFSPWSTPFPSLGDIHRWWSLENILPSPVRCQQNPVGWSLTTISSWWFERLPRVVHPPSSTISGRDHRACHCDHISEENQWMKKDEHRLEVDRPAEVRVDAQRVSLVSADKEYRQWDQWYRSWTVFVLQWQCNHTLKRSSDHQQWYDRPEHKRRVSNSAEERLDHGWDYWTRRYPWRVDGERWPDCTHWTDRHRH